MCLCVCLCVVSVCVCAYLCLLVLSPRNACFKVFRNGFLLAVISSRILVWSSNPCCCLSMVFVYSLAFLRIVVCKHISTFIHALSMYGCVCIPENVSFMNLLFHSHSLCLSLTLPPSPPSRPLFNNAKASPWFIYQG